ncbi:MAG: outer membrane protein transport protein [Syntrophales bacterium]|nr:outer membrane protein transport protein [Syntrophales bacterium]
MMKKLFLCVGISALLMFFFTFELARASGMYVEGVGTRAMTMGGAFTGLADDSSAVHWNPSGLAQLKGAGFAASLYTMSSFLRDRNSVSNLDPAEQDWTKGDYFSRVYPTEPKQFDDYREFWPFAAAMPAITAHKNFGDYTIGVGAFPIAGAYSRWEDTIKDTTDADIDASLFFMVMLMDFNVSIAKKITDKLSLGVGLDLVYLKLQGDIEKDYRNSNVSWQPDYSSGIDAEADGMGVQGVIGFLYKFSPKWSLGAIFRTGAKFDVNGDLGAWFTIRGPDGQPMMDLEQKTNYYHEFVYPPSWGVGIAYKPTQTLTLTADWQRIDWTKFKWPFADLHLEKKEPLLKEDIVKDPDWSAADSYRFGLEYKYNKRLTLRGGYMSDDSGVPNEAAGFATSIIGDPIQYANIGFGYQWDVWNLDFMVGTAWGEPYPGVKHN